MFGLPESTYFNKLMPKNKFYDKLEIDRKLERSFIDQISSIRWLHKLSADLLNLEKGNIIDEVEVFLINLKTSEFDLNILRQMDRQLHYHLIFIMEFEKQYQLWTSYKEESTGSVFKVGNYYHTNWITEENFSLHLDGLNMDTVYENLVRQIAGDTLSNEKSGSLKESVERQNEREKIEKEIEKLRKKIRSEKQFNRQVELNNQLKLLMKELEKL